MKFTRIMTSRATYKKQKSYTFPEFTEEELSHFLKKGNEYTQDSPYLVFHKGTVYGFCRRNGILVLEHYHSCDSFRLENINEVQTKIKK